MRTSIEVADIFRSAGPAYRAAHAGHLSLGQLKVMTSIENCRTAALGGHVEACDDCGHWRIAYNSCRNRHCPKCQGAAARTWLAAREADLLPVGYFHVVFTLPAQVADIAWQNKAAVYDLLFRAAADTMLTIAADPKHLGARVTEQVAKLSRGHDLTKACLYMLKRWDAFTRFLDDGRVCLSNNAAERALRCIPKRVSLCTPYSSVCKHWKHVRANNATRATLSGHRRFYRFRHQIGGADLMRGARYDLHRRKHAGFDQMSYRMACGA